MTRSDKVYIANCYPQRHRSTCVDSNPSRDSEKERPGSDPLLTGNESGGKSVRVIVAFALVAVVALVVGVVVFVIMRNGRCLVFTFFFLISECVA